MTDNHEPTAKARIIDVLGWYGTIAILGAYALVSFDVVSSDGAMYQLLNLTGALGVLTVSWTKRVTQSAVLNGVWALVAAVALVQILV